MLLSSLHSVHDLRRLSPDKLAQLADEVRDYIIEVVSRNGGHLASSLGVVELTIALHYVFNTPRDKIIWDVGHQCYAHKIITGRKDRFASLRTYGGISGFPKRDESEFDAFNTGHSSTSLSLAVGEAVARDFKKQRYDIIGVIGDGSLTGGMAFEALNHIGHLRKNVIIVINDNEHSISKNVGALSEYLMKLITGSLYNRLRRRSHTIIKRIPRYGNALYEFLYKMEASLKGILLPGHFFEALGIRYFGPVDGHNIELMIDLFRRIREINSGPRIVHVITKKGKGYEHAEKDPARFHGIGPFDIKSGKSIATGGISFSAVAGKTLASIARTDKNIVAITAAMKLGTGLYEFEKIAPRRFFDVGIAEQHALTFAAAMASKGMKPFVSIYSTFLQRAIDQLIHDVAIMRLPVRLLIDRAGIVGDDGETHHGIFYIAILKNVPNMTILAPSDALELRDMIYYAVRHDSGPLAIRFPRGKTDDASIAFGKHNRFTPGAAHKLTQGNDVAIFAVGDMVSRALAVHDTLKSHRMKSTVINLLSIKPLDSTTITQIVRQTRHFITMENGIMIGGVGEMISAMLPCALASKRLFSVGFPDAFVTHGKNEDLFTLHGMDVDSIVTRLLRACGK